MEKLNIFFFSVFLSLILLIEGIGIPNGRNISMALIITFSFICIFLLIHTKKTLILPKKLIFLLVGFILTTIPSVIFSSNIEHSIEYLVFYISIFIVLIYVYNNKQIFKKITIIIVFVSSLVFCFYSILLSLSASSIFSLPLDGYQFVYPKFASHNHLGDFLLLPLSFILFTLVREKPKVYNFLSLALFMPFFLFSYSRSAYLDLILLTLVIVVISVKTIRKTRVFKLFTAAGIILICGILFFATARDVEYPLFSRINTFLSSEHELQDKYFFSERGEYARQAFSSIIQSPFGVGPGNFIDASEKYRTTSSRTHTAHNIFLEMFVENGIPAGIVFILIMLELLRRSEMNLYFFLALAMLINFQTDYTYRIYSFLLLFFVFLGLSYKGKTINNKY